AGWVGVALVYQWARSICAERAGLLAAGGMVGSIYFFRYTRLAETDAIVAPSIILAYFAIWQANRQRNDLPGRASRETSLWQHAAAVGAALATLAKGAPGAFPLIFLIFLSLSRRSLEPLRGFVRSGAPITFAVIALPWFLLVWLSPQARSVISGEARLLWRGGGHGEPFYEYFLWIAYGCLPWTLFGVSAIVQAVRSWRDDGVSRELLLAVGSVLIPLSVVGQKQPHYLMSLIPILFVVTGVRVERMLGDPESRRLLNGLVLATAGLLGTAAAALAVMSAVDRSPDLWGYALSGVLAVGAVVGVLRFQSRGSWPALATLGLTTPVALVIAFSFFWPIESGKPDPRELAATINRQIGSAPAAWWGQNDALAVSYYLPRRFPARDEDPLTSAPPPSGGELLIDCEDADHPVIQPSGYSLIFSQTFQGERAMIFAPNGSANSH
ncbi:MAG: glycosyltransferase family 39 protein, partial [Phycisphaerae bacterium]|nr:glycosyltransferase family 39 protein [Phycisphaerae bacterium]